MKKFLSVILTLIIALSLFSGAFSVNAETSIFETDFKDYTSTKGFKVVYDSSGNEVVGKFTFSKTDEGLRYKREANEAFYNPSKQDKTTASGYKVFPVSQTGEIKDNIFQVESNSCYKVEITYNCATLSEGATITLGANLSNGSGADTATNGTAPKMPITTEIGGSENAVINKTGSGTISGYFATGELPPSGSKFYDKLFIMLNSPKQSDVDITLTYLKVSPVSSITVHDLNSETDTVYYGDAGSSFSLGEEESVLENYYIDSKSQYSKKSNTLYADKELNNIIENAVFPQSGNVTYYVANENLSLENQEVFCGFDSFTLRKLKTGDNQTTIGFKTMEEALPQGASITEEAAYTGNKSLKVEFDGAGEKVIYIGNGYEMTAGATYRLSVKYRSVNNNNLGSATLRFTSGNGASSVIKSENISNNTAMVTKDSLNADASWKSATLYYTADIAENTDKDLYLAPVLTVSAEDKVALYIDTCVISKVVNAEGTSILKNEDDTQALRFFFSYDMKDEEILTDTKAFKIAKRGILYASEESIEDDTLFNLESAKDNTDIFNKELTDLSSCWDYDNASEKIVFSAYLKDIAKKHYNQKLCVRGYVVLSDGTVFYSSVIRESVNSVKEKNSVKDMYYELVEAENGDYRDINIYIPTSDVSGKYYIRYKLRYTLKAQADPVENSNKSNSGYNQETYRIMGADLTEKEGNTFNVVTKTILHSGELEFAVKEAASGVKDFIGGYHGDEIMNYAKLFVDGEQIVINSETKGITACRNIGFETDTVMYRCGSGTVENPTGTPVCNHYLKYDINSKSGITVNQKVTWLVDDFRNETPMVCMFTIARYSGKNKITDTVEYYKWDGSYVDTVDATGYGANDDATVRSSYDGPAYARAYSKESGFSAYVGYKNISGLTNTFDNYVWIRPYGDNKIYFKSNGSKTNKKGEVWEWVDYFNIDYVAP